MNSKQVNKKPSGEPLSLPEPDPENITVLTRNLPNKPILPWNHYDSPWRDGEPENPEASENSEQADESSDNQSATEPESAEKPELSETAAQLDKLYTEELATVPESLSEDTLESSETGAVVDESPDNPPTAVATETLETPVVDKSPVNPPTAVATETSETPSEELKQLG
ncbi:MAG: hypothetical protein F6J94_14435 [Moorea sp. SIO1F2]|uniref:hypothetical protein n=1 Tax=unclassified Moorena TaxID=2683338 RepID=UPI0013BC9FAD|nr:MULTISPECIES: hypothetical protein [unclassified Moorena]NEO02111.1 hypothetical protein [Moorena sp. SIO3I7]NEO10218.1 hypothetical protein [Moorena sp. SIO3I8]NEO23860.1 hypothetical protein [Moorena sp. SIO4A5]NEP26350.1 hypothetical protein [Moorena sp. SIO3I6]NEQ62129.1 hypothetical protein [Moorena sp. SIO4A1]